MGRRCPNCNTKMNLQIIFEKRRKKSNPYYICDKCNNKIKYQPKESKTQDLLLTDMKAQAYSNSYQNTFFQSFAIPKKLLDNIYKEDFIYDKFVDSSKWRLDHTLKDEKFRIDRELKNILLIIKKILLRGKLTLISPFLEKKIKKLLNLKNKTFTINNLQNLEVKINKDFDNEETIIDFQSPYEKLFYEKILPNLFGKEILKYTTPQVYLSSLLDDHEKKNIETNQRVDFFIKVDELKLVVEIDGEKYHRNNSKDNKRDSLLKRHDINIIRIKTKEIDNFLKKLNNYPNIEKLNQFISGNYLNKTLSYRDTNYYRYIYSIKIAHMLEISIIEALLSGNIDLNEKINMYCDIFQNIIDKKILNQIIQYIKTDISNLFNNLKKLYEYEGFNIEKLKIKNWSDNSKNLENYAVITNSIYKKDIDNYKDSVFIINDISYHKSFKRFRRSSEPKYLSNVNKKPIKYFLKYIFRFEEFNEGQFEAIKKPLIQEDSIVLLPTGGGKSIAFQLASFLLPGICIIIEPTRALIHDQVDNLKRQGIDRAVGITSDIKKPEVRKKVYEQFSNGEYLFTYVSPERLQIQNFRDILTKMTLTMPINIVAIDEAHCVSEWGHDFRTSYLNVGKNARAYCQTRNSVPPLLALTGTASHSVLRDVQRELEIKDFDAIITPKTFNRNELKFSIVHKKSEKKKQVLQDILMSQIPDFFNDYPSTLYNKNKGNAKCGLVFCPHVNGDYGIYNVAKELQQSLKHTSGNVNIYSGKTPKHLNLYKEWEEYKNEVSTRFKNDDILILVTTKSFGMGIDKSNIRYTIHYGLPQSIEAFYQEAGRAGRNRKDSICYVIVSNDYIERTKRLLDPSNSVDEIHEIMENERDWDSDDDITRNMFFHKQAFQGVEKEVSIIREILKEIKDINFEKEIKTTFPKIDGAFFKNILGMNPKWISYQKRNIIEKGVHRLVILGVIKDYTIDYSHDEFTIIKTGKNKEEIKDYYLEYVSGYSKGAVKIENNKISKFLDDDYFNFVLKICKVLINFIYETIEKGRRRALREMLALTQSIEGNDRKDIVRERILNYFETTFSEELEKIISSEKEGLDEIIDLVDGFVETETGKQIGGIRSPKDAREVRGQTARYLESLPDHPGLLFLRALSEIMIPDNEKEIIKENLIAAYNQIMQRENILKDKIYKFTIWLIDKICEVKGEHYKLILTILYDIFGKEIILFYLNNNNFNEPYYRNIENLFLLPKLFIVNELSEKIINIIE